MRSSQLPGQLKLTLNDRQIVAVPREALPWTTLPTIYTVWFKAHITSYYLKIIHIVSFQPRIVSYRLYRIYCDMSAKNWRYTRFEPPI